MVSPILPSVAGAPENVKKITAPTIGREQHIQRTLAMTVAIKPHALGNCGKSRARGSEITVRQSYGETTLAIVRGNARGTRELMSANWRVKGKKFA